MKPLTFLILTAAFAAAAVPASADDDDFIGLYQGIFEEAGSLDTISIAPAHSGGYRVVLHAERYIRCEGPDRSAIATSDATVTNGVLVRTNSAAVCSGDGKAVNWADGEMSLSNDEELLTWTSPQGRQTVYHRISN